jgi:phthalate 4,5-dioxygenase oxygenase subunit
VPKSVDWRAFDTRYVWPDGTERPELEPSYSVRA